MVRGLGVDVVLVLRIAGVLRRHGPRFAKRVLHASERQVYEGLPAAARPQYVAGCWATKEAVFKSLDNAEQRTFAMAKYYKYAENGRPAVGPDADRFLLSVSHDTDVLVATVIRLR